MLLNIQFGQYVCYQFPEMAQKSSLSPCKSLILSLPENHKSVSILSLSLQLTENCEGSNILSSLQAKNPVTVSWMLSEDSQDKDKGLYLPPEQ